MVEDAASLHPGLTTTRIEFESSAEGPQSGAYLKAFRRRPQKSTADTLCIRVSRIQYQSASGGTFGMTQPWPLRLKDGAHLSIRLSQGCPCIGELPVEPRGFFEHLDRRSCVPAVPPRKTLNATKKHLVSYRALCRWLPGRWSVLRAQRLDEFPGQTVLQSEQVCDLG